MTGGTWSLRLVSYADGLNGSLHRVGDYWGSTKVFIGHLFDVSSDALHLIVSVLLMFGYIAVRRSSLDRLEPLLFVFAFQLLNELNDLRAQQWSNLAFELAESAKDISLTMLVPIMLYIFAKTRPDLVATKGKEGRGWVTRF